MPKKSATTKAVKSGSDSKSAKKVSKSKKVTKTVSKKTEPVEVVAPAETVADDKSVSLLLLLRVSLLSNSLIYG